MPDLSHEQIEENFAELNPLMSAAEAAVESNRCLYCYDAPCTQACPTHIDVPSFIKKIASGNLTGSARVIFDANPIGATCSRVCPVEVLCEGACVEKTLLQKPIEIGRLQRFATDHAIDNGKHLLSVAPANGKSVGIIGSGPAGISCAVYLARLGYAVTTYERKAKPGGLNTYGMAEYKMTQIDSLEEVRLAEKMGVVIRTLADVGSADLPFDGIIDQHDAVFLAVGLGSTNWLNIPGEEFSGVVDALAFIERIKSREWHSVPLGRRVAVIGAGNTAIDAVTQAKRLGAERVMLVYRRTEAEAPAYDYEMELAKKDGVEFHWQTYPTEIVGDGSVSGLRCRHADGSEFTLACDQVIKAIGQERSGAFFTEVCGVAVDERGRVVVDEMLQTSRLGIFAGGDCVNGGGEAVEAAQMGKHAAQGIHLALTGETVRFAGA